MVLPAYEITPPNSEATLEGSSKPPTPNQDVVSQPSKTFKTGDDNSQPTQYHNVVCSPHAPKHDEIISALQQTKEAISGCDSAPTMNLQQLRPGIIPVEPAKAPVAAPLVYHPIPRLRHEVDYHAGIGTITRVDAFPMERWERESIKDQAWNGVAGVYVRSSLGNDEVLG